MIEKLEVETDREGNRDEKCEQQQRKEARITHWRRPQARLPASFSRFIAHLLLFSVALVATVDMALLKSTLNSLEVDSCWSLAHRH